MMAMGDVLRGYSSIRILRRSAMLAGNAGEILRPVGFDCRFAISWMVSRARSQCIPSMHTARYAGAGRVVNGKLYVAGGSDGVHIFPTLEAYDPVGDSWAPKADILTA